LPGQEVEEDPLGYPGGQPGVGEEQERGRNALKRHNTKYSKKIFPEKELRVLLSPNFHIHVSVNDLYNPTIDLPILLQENMWNDLGNI
jgi:hypothetical protein